MPDEHDPDEVPVNVVSDKQDDAQDVPENLSELLEHERARSAEYEEKLKHALADYENLSKKTRSEIENGISSKTDELMLDFLKIYDDFERAREAFAEGGAQTEGLDSILKNMESLLKKHGVLQIDALGEPFDPNLHEAISVTADPALDENTITKEIRKGYISQQRVIRPTLVEISKKE